MIKSVIGGVVVAALSCAQAAAASPAPSAGWIVTPTEAGCRVDLELVGRSGAVTPVSLSSDGRVTSLTFTKDNLPARAFLPLRIDRERFSNLMLRSEDGSGELILSEETEAAMRKGESLDIAWIAQEPMSASLSGSDQGLTDLRACGAQSAARFAKRQNADQAERDRAAAEARARTLETAQLAAVQAQAAAADAQRRQIEAQAERQQRADAQDAQRSYEEARRRAWEEQQRAYEQQVQDYQSQWQAQWRPAYPRWGYYSRY